MTNDGQREFLQEMMWPSDDVFLKVVKARNVKNVDTGTLIRTFVSAVAAERGITVKWPLAANGKLCC